MKTDWGTCKKLARNKVRIQVLDQAPGWYWFNDPAREQVWGQVWDQIWDQVRSRIGDNNGN